MVTAIVLLVDDHRCRAGEQRRLCAALRAHRARIRLPFTRVRSRYTVEETPHHGSHFVPVTISHDHPRSPNPSPSAVNVKNDIATRYAAAIVPRELYATTPETALSRAESYVKTTPAPAAVYDMSMETMLSLQVRAGTRIGHRNPLPPSPPLPPGRRLRARRTRKCTTACTPVPRVGRCHGNRHEVSSWSAPTYVHVH